jgi:hypothetical protein
MNFMVKKCIPFNHTPESPTDGCPGCYAGRRGRILKTVLLNGTLKSVSQGWELWEEWEL